MLLSVCSVFCSIVTTRTYASRVASRPVWMKPESPVERKTRNWQKPQKTIYAELSREKRYSQEKSLDLGDGAAAGAGAGVAAASGAAGAGAAGAGAAPGTAAGAGDAPGAAVALAVALFAGGFFFRLNKFLNFSQPEKDKNSRDLDLVYQGWTQH